MITIELSGERKVTTHTNDFMILACDGLIVQLPAGHRVEIQETEDDVSVIMHYPKSESGDPAGTSVALESILKEV